VTRRSGRIGSPVQHDVLDALAQLGVELVVHAELPRVDDAHRQAGANGVIQEDRVDRRAHRIVAAEAEAHVGNAARHLGVRQVLANPARRVDIVDGVVVVLVDAGGDGEHVRVEHDVLGRKPDAVDQQVITPAADSRLALEGVGLAFLVERHHDDRGAVTQDELRLAQERLLPFLERNRIDDRLALHALQAGLDDFPLRRVDHQRHARDVRLGSDEVQEAHHRRLRIEHRLVHVDVDDLCAARDLLARDLDRAREVAAQDQLGKRARAGHVRPLADVDEQRIVANRQRLETGEAHYAGHGYWIAVCSIPSPALRERVQGEGGR
jgi:hypothetical protein